MTPDELRTALETLGLTRKQAAEALGVHVTTVTRWLNGDRRISATTALALRYVLREHGGHDA